MRDLAALHPRPSQTSVRNPSESDKTWGPVEVCRARFQPYLGDCGATAHNGSPVFDTNDPSGTDAGPSQTPLAALILQAGLVPADKLEAALDEAVREECGLGAVLLGRGLIAEGDLGRLLAKQHRLPFVDLLDARPQPAALALLEGERARRYRALPLLVDDGIPLVAVADPTDRVASDLEMDLGVKPRLAVAPAAKLAGLIAQAYPATPSQAGPSIVLPTPADSKPLHGRAARLAKRIARSNRANEQQAGPRQPGEAAADPESRNDPVGAQAPTQAAGHDSGTTLRARAARGVFWTGLGNWGNQIAAVVVFVILSRLLEPEAFGLVALASVFVGFIQVIADQGLADAVVQRRNLESEHLDTAFWTAMAFGVLLSLLIAALAFPIAGLLGQERLAPVLIALALAIPMGSSTLVQRAVLTRDLAFRSLTLRTLAAIAVGSAVGIGAAVLGFGVWSLVAQNLANQFAGMIVLWSVTGWKPRLRFSRSHFRDLFGFGINVVGFRLLNYFNRRTDELLIGSYLGAVALGFYSVAYRMLILLISVTSNLIDFVAFPLYARLQSDRDRLRSAYYKTTSFVALTSFPVFTGIMIMAPEIVLVLFGSKWSESVPVMQALALFGVMQAINYLNGTMIKAMGKPSWRVVIVGITAVLNVIAFFIAVRYGILAVAIALVVVGYLVMPISYWAVNRLVPINLRVYFRHIRDPLLASLLLGAVMAGLRHALSTTSPLFVLFIASCAGTLVYCAAIRIIARPLADEVLALARDALPPLGLRRRLRLVTRIGR